MANALVLGGTGVVGTELLRQLQNGSDFDSIFAIVRKKPDLTVNLLTKVRWIEVSSFDELEKAAEYFKVEQVFCALGTTIKKAKSQSAFKKVDVEYPYRAARLAALQGAKKFNVVSSVGANEKSSVFYSRAKGEMERLVAGAGLHEVNIFRPSFLLGERSEKRFLESITGNVLNWMSSKTTNLEKGPLGRVLPIQASQVAHAMLRVARQAPRPGVHIFEGSVLHAL